MPVRFFLETNYNRQEVQQQIDRGLQANLKAAAIIWHAGVIRKLTGQRGGNVYIVPGTGQVRKVPVTVRPTHPRYKVSSFTRLQKKRVGGRTWTASRPGEPPAVRLGDLRTSYRFIVEQNEAAIGSPLKYALSLEKGTRNMAPRPHIKPAFEDYRARILQALEANVI